MAYSEATWVLDQLGLKRASLKTLIHGPNVTEKRKVFALVTETLKYRAVLLEVMEAAGWAKTPEGRRMEVNMALVLLYDLLISERGVQCGGKLKEAVMAHRTRLKAEMTKLKVKRQARTVKDLLPPELRDAVVLPRWVRVNAIKATPKTVLEKFKAQGWTVVDSATVALHHLLTAEPKGKWIWPDTLLDELFAMPPSTDLHDNALYLDGTLILQDKASCFPAAALGVNPSTVHVIDGCAAPGNKTSHLAALMKNKGKISAFDTDGRRLELLQRLTKKAGATNITGTHKSFLDVNPNDPAYADVTHILLDPSCSGSGMVARLDELLDSSSSVAAASSNHSAPASEYDDNYNDSSSAEDRLKSLSEFQLAAIEHGLSFPSVQRLVYSTCSIHEIENESVVSHIVQRHPDFELVKVFPKWTRRGNPSSFDGAEFCVRTLPRDDHVIGFFVTLFQRRKAGAATNASTNAKRSLENDDGAIDEDNDDDDDTETTEAEPTTSDAKKRKNKKKNEKKKLKKQRLTSVASTQD